MPDTYTTISGDDWDFILYKLHGKGAEYEMARFIAANPRQRRVKIFPAGVVLNLPRLRTPYKEEPVPPWQR